jgi:class 3 adenylate cyclase
MWSRSPGQMGEVIGRLSDFAVTGARDAGGTVLRERGEGDSHFLVFDRASAAVRAACSIQRSIVAESWPADLAPRLRIGIHCGECEVHDDDYLGVTVNQAARVRGAAHGGQIITSHVVALLAGDLGDIRLRRLGMFRVRDFEQPEVLYQVHAPGLPERFPAPATLDNAAPPIAAVVAVDLVRFREHVEPLGSAGLVAEQTKFLRYLRGRFDAADGRFIKFFGDGCFAAFDSPLAALHFVHEAAQDVGSAGYQLRVGFHIGQVELVDNDLVGTTVIITHELMQNAEPGLALISRSASDVLRSYGVEAEDGPVLSLASVSGSWQTYTLPIADGSPR